MQYAQNTIGSGGLQAAAANYPSGANAMPVAPKTLASAIGRIDGLSGRLAEVRNRLSHLADVIGGPRGLNGQADNMKNPPGGAIMHLNDSADNAHTIVADIEDLLTHIGGALG